MCSIKSSTSVDKIIKNNLRYIPNHLFDTYTKIIMNTYKLSNLYSGFRFRYLHEQLVRYVGLDYPHNENVMIIEQGENGLREKFFKVNRIEGRFDYNLPFMNISQLLQFYALKTCLNDYNEDINKLFSRISNTERIIILADMSISGISLLGELSDILKIYKKLSTKIIKPEVIALVICGTESAITKLSRVYSKVIVHEIIPNKYSLCSEESSIFFNSEKISHVLELTQWFATDVINDNDLIVKMARILNDPEITLWGFGKEGWIITTDMNTPNNSLPLLWLKPKGHPYRPPFPRVSSRTYNTIRWNLRPVYWEIINASGAKAHVSKGL